MTGNHARKFTWEDDDIEWPVTTPPVRDGYDPNQPRHPKGDPDGGKWSPAGGTIGELERHTEMRDYTEKEMDWEYNREYLTYTKPHFPHAFASREDFQSQYDAAPLRHLSIDELRGLGNSMAASGLNKGIDWVHATFGHRRDTKRILESMTSGKTAPPIILENEKGRLWLMAGQTRLAAGLALGKSIPAKVISVSAKKQKRDAMLGDAAIQLGSNAEPRSLYVRRNVLNWKDIDAHFKEQGVESTLGETMHVTIAFSHTPVNWMEIAQDYFGNDQDGQMRIVPGGPRVLAAFGPEKNVLVLQFKSSALEYRHQDICENHGASWDWDGYHPHITITYKEFGDDIEPYIGEIVLGPEIFEELDEDWRSNVREN